VKDVVTAERQPGKESAEDRHDDPDWQCYFLVLKRLKITCFIRLIIRSIRFFNDAYITITNRTGISQPTVGGESNSATAWAMSFMLFGHEASIASIRV